MPTNLKAEARDCRGCGASIPEQPSGPGRPREFCTRDCRSQYPGARSRPRSSASVRRPRTPGISIWTSASTGFERPTGERESASETASTGRGPR
jgi:hypothetical protein